MFERGIFKHLTPTLYEPVIRVPFVIHKPQQSIRVDITSPTSCVDLVPTLLSGIGQPLPDWCEGQILPIFDEPSLKNKDRSIYILEAKQNAKKAPLSLATVTLIKGEHKLIHYRGYEGLENHFEFYDLENDPEELNDIYTSQPEAAKEMRDELEQKLFEVNQKIRG
jgi:arylsulfatase A-like enzyme